MVSIACLELAPRLSVAPRVPVWCVRIVPVRVYQFSECLAHAVCIYCVPRPPNPELLHLHQLLLNLVSLRLYVRHFNDFLFCDLSIVSNVNHIHLVSPLIGMSYSIDS